jgi:hypothetical protein
VSSTNPFTTTFDGRLGGLQFKQLFVRNDSYDHWYTNITVTPIDTLGLGLVHGVKEDGSVYEGFSWKLIERSVPPALIEWDAVDPGNALVLSQNLGSSLLGDTTTFLPFWVQVSVARNQPIEVITSITLRVSAMEYVV